MSQKISSTVGSILFWGFLVWITWSAFSLRLHELDLRPLHGDEAVQGKILGEMLAGEYAYDPYEFHGPLLHNLAAPLAIIKGEGSSGWNDLQISTLRTIPALATSLLCLLPLLLRPWISRIACCAIAVFFAFDPMLVYFGRDYIAEGLFVFTITAFLLCSWRALRLQSFVWAVISGVCFTAAWATKETFVLHVATAAVAAMLVFFPAIYRQVQQKTAWLSQAKTSARQLLLPCMGAIFVTWLLLYSQLFTDVEGLWNSIATYLVYLERSGGEGHEKPFFYYWETMFLDRHFTAIKPKEMDWQTYLNTVFKPARLSWQDYVEVKWESPARMRPWQGELALVVFAILGVVSAWLPQSLHWQKRPCPRCLSWLFLSACGLLLAYSLLAYKTIWSILGLAALLCFPAGCFVIWAIGIPVLLWRKQFFYKLLAPLAAVLLLVSSSFVAWNWRNQICWQNFDVYNSVDASNPWVYSQAPTAFLLLPQKLVQVAENPASRFEGKQENAMRVAVASHSGLWPLPWYLRNENIRVGYYTNAEQMPQDSTTLRKNFAVIVAGPDQAKKTRVLAEKSGYIMANPVQNYAHSWVSVWVRDDL